MWTFFRPYLSLICCHGNDDKGSETRSPELLRRTDYHCGSVSVLLVSERTMDGEKCGYYRASR
ncbi:hypothetical protein BH23ACT11_BH23ACT11_29830 [soil metagenome]